MNPNLSSSRRCAISLIILSGVLVLGIVQWSFLPLLIQNGQETSTSILELSASHTTKFAAPFNCLFIDGLNPCLVVSRITVRRIASRVVRLSGTPISSRDDFSLTHRPLRAPPFA